MNISRLVLAGLSGGAGKTIVSLGLARAFRRAGKRVKPFKKGPDYIDSVWLGLATGESCTNLDPHFLSADRIRSLYHDKVQGHDLGLVEGNRGLFDGKDEQGSCSTAELARQLDGPVILILDGTKMTRTAAAVIQGCANFEKGMHLAGVIINRTAGERHRSVLQKSIEAYTDVPVLGMLPKLTANPIPERHMGLMSDQEMEGSAYENGQKALDFLADTAEQWLDLDRIWDVAATARPLAPVPAPLWDAPPVSICARIGYVHDAALWFYYPENLEALERAGAELVKVSILSDAPWPELDGLYLGGGFPETMAERISRNQELLEHVRSLSASGMPIYAECGGFMFLCQQLEFEGRTYPMAGVFPVSTSFCPRPQGLGYTEAEVVKGTVFYPRGTVVIGHEFHYSRCVKGDSAVLDFSMRMRRGNGMLDGLDGLVTANTFAGYNHIHALAVPMWAENFVSAAIGYARGRHEG